MKWAPLALASWFAALPAMAGPTVLSGDAVSDQVNGSLRAAGLAPRMAISSHRMFPGCASPLAVDVSGAEAGRVRVTCADTGWSRDFRVSETDVPVMEQVSEIIVVSRESLARGTVIAPHHLMLVPASSRRSAGAITAPQSAVGRKLRLNLGAGQVLLARHLEQDFLVTKGVPVEIALERRGIRIELTGIPQAAAQLGEVVSVVNASSGQVLRAVVISRNKVAVRPNMRRSMAVVDCESPLTPCGKE